MHLAQVSSLRPDQGPSLDELAPVAPVHAPEIGTSVAPGQDEKVASAFLGLNFANLAAPAVAHLVAERTASDRFQYVVTPNADHLVRLSRDRSLVPLYEEAWLRLLDSRVVATAARLLGMTPPIVAPGSDITRLLLLQHLRPGERITIVGLPSAYVPGLVERCGLAPPAHYDPPMGFDARPKAFAQTVDFIVANPARFIFVAVGSPRQERLCAAVARTGKATGTALCIGASLEYLSGAAPRAPLWMQQARLEWLHRLVWNPRRLARRYLVDSPPIFRLLMRERNALPPMTTPDEATTA